MGLSLIVEADSTHCNAPTIVHCRRAALSPWRTHALPGNAPTFVRTAAAPRRWALQGPSALPFGRHPVCTAHLCLLICAEEQEIRGSSSAQCVRDPTTPLPPATQALGGARHSPASRQRASPSLQAGPAGSKADPKAAQPKQHPGECHACLGRGHVCGLCLHVHVWR